jgi:hypothetical protein
MSVSLFSFPLHVRIVCMCVLLFESVLFFFSVVPFGLPVLFCSLLFCSNITICSVFCSGSLCLVRFGSVLAMFDCSAPCFGSALLCSFRFSCWFGFCSASLFGFCFVFFVSVLFVGLPVCWGTFLSFRIRIPIQPQYFSRHARRFPVSWEGNTE